MSEHEMEDDELQSLLDQLDDQDKLVESMEEEAEPKGTDGDAASKGEEGEKGEPGEPEEPLFAAPEVTLRPNEEPPIQLDGLVATDARRHDSEKSTIKQSTPSETVELENPNQKYLDLTEDVTNDVLAACRSDRQEAQDVINIYKKAIEDAQNHNSPPARMWVDGLVKAVEVKAGINGNAIKALEANAKMLAATKAGTQINQQINVGDAGNLDEVLQQELGSEDEY